MYDLAGDDTHAKAGAACAAPSIEPSIRAMRSPLNTDGIGLNWKTQMTLPSSVDVISELPSLVNSIVLISCREFGNDSSWKGWR
jgi:hypothetical protein